MQDSWGHHPKQTQHPLLGNPRVRQEFLPQYLFCFLFLFLLLLEPGNIISGPGNRVEMGQLRRRCVFLWDAGAWRSHSPTSSYDCQGQKNAEAHSPCEVPLSLSWGCERGSQMFGEQSGPTWPREKATLLVLFTHSVTCLQTLTESLLCTQHTLR